MCKQSQYKWYVPLIARMFDMTTPTPSPSVSNRSTNNSGETSIRVFVFSGKREEWETWKEKFFVRANIRCYEELISGEKVVPNTQNKDGTKKTLSTDDES
jgi:hypothetical protein